MKKLFKTALAACAFSTTLVAASPQDGDLEGTLIFADEISSLRQEAAEDRIILFDGTNWRDHWSNLDGSPSQWEVQPDGSAEVKTGNAVSKEEFSDFQLHIEFLCPPAEGKQGQAKSNSGVYIHGRYELQVLDSHGIAPANNLCGGIYQIAAPLVNASKPAGQWQSFDIIFRAPRFAADKTVSEQPRVTILHNGVVIHNNVILPSTTPGGIDRTMVERGPILLQDHGDPVRYRNIWARRL